jgi:hypothetical protein
MAFLKSPERVAKIVIDIAEHFQRKSGTSRI